MEDLLGAQQQIEAKSLELREQEFGCSCPYRNFRGRCCMRGFMNSALLEKKIPKSIYQVRSARNGKECETPRLDSASKVESLQETVK